MIALEDLISAAVGATQDQRAAALRILQGALPLNQPLETRRAVAQKTGFSVTSLRRWKVPGHAIDGAVRFRVGEVLDYLASDDFKRRAAALRAERKEEAQRAKWRVVA